MDVRDLAINYAKYPGLLDREFILVLSSDCFGVTYGETFAAQINKHGGVHFIKWGEKGELGSGFGRWEYRDRDDFLFKMYNITCASVAIKSPDGCRLRRPTLVVTALYNSEVYQ